MATDPYIIVRRANGGPKQTVVHFPFEDEATFVEFCETIGGEQGEQGPPGPQGPAGNDGNDGATGPQGVQGEIGLTGQTGATGSQGPQGNVGATGSQGIPGVPGPSVGTAAFGYSTGAGGVVTQLTNKATAVTIHKLCGTITMHGAALAAGAIVTFTVTNNQVLAADFVSVKHVSAGTLGAYGVTSSEANGSFTITVRNNSAGSLSQAIVIRFLVIRGVVA